MAQVARLGLTIAGGWLGGPWGAVAGTILGGFLFPARFKAGETNLAGMQFSAVTPGARLPILYGTQRIPGQYIWYGNWQKHDAGGKGKGGGSGGSKGGGQSTYTASFALTLCEGEITSVARIFEGGKALDLAALDYLELTGVADPLDTAEGLEAATYMQTYGSTEGQTELLGYPSVAYVLFRDYDLGYGGAVPNLTFEVSRLDLSDNDRIPASLLTLPLARTACDLNPVTILADLLTNARYGLGFAEADLDEASFLAAAEWCAARDLYISPIFAEAQEGLAWLEELLCHFDGGLSYWQGQFHLTHCASQQLRRYYLTDTETVVGGHPEASEATDETDAGHVGADRLVCLDLETGIPAGPAVTREWICHLSPPAADEMELVGLFLGPALAEQAWPAKTQVRVALTVTEQGQGGGNIHASAFPWLWRAGNYAQTLLGDGTPRACIRGGDEGSGENPPPRWRNVIGSIAGETEIEAGDRIALDVWAYLHGESFTHYIEASPAGAVRTGGMVTITIGGPLGFGTAVGQTVTIAGVTSVGGTNFNGSFVIATLPDGENGTTLTYAQALADDTGGGGTVLLAGHWRKVRWAGPTVYSEGADAIDPACFVEFRLPVGADWTVGPDDYVKGSPPRLGRPGAQDTNNHIRVIYSDREHDYGDATAEASDMWSVELRGDRSQELRMGGVTRASLAEWLAARYLALRTVQRTGLVVGLGPAFLGMAPGDLVEITDADYGLAAWLGRIVSIRQYPDQHVEIEALEEIAEEAWGTAGSEAGAPGGGTGGGDDPGPTIIF